MFEAKTETEPLVTVVMPVHNALPYLDAAVASVLAQTHSDFRLAIYDDHSSDGSYEAALAWAERDTRISVKRGLRRLGPCGSSNAAADMAQTEFVARMDADDLIAPDRLEIELAVFERFPKAVLIGSTFDMIDAAGRIIYPAKPGRMGGEIPPIAHTSILYRRQALEAIGGYRENTDYFEDHDLFRRFAHFGQIVVVNRPLAMVRFAGQHARLSDEPLAVLHKINRLYDSNLNTNDRKRPLSPMTFYSIANLAMLCSRRPRLLGLMLRWVSFERPLLTLLVAAIVALAEVSPGLARLAWQAASTVRGWLETKAESHSDVYLWSSSARQYPDKKQETAPAEAAGAV